MYYVYILKSTKDQRTYVGYCENVARRLQDHNAGRVDATKRRRPLKLLYTEDAPTLAQAKMRERYWKSGGGRRKLRFFFEKGFPPSEAGRGSPTE